jgi:hypothetical protein
MLHHHSNPWAVVLRRIERIAVCYPLYFGLLVTVCSILVTHSLAVPCSISRIGSTLYVTACLLQRGYHRNAAGRLHTMLHAPVLVPLLSLLCPIPSGNPCIAISYQGLLCLVLIIGHCSGTHAVLQDISNVRDAGQVACKALQAEAFRDFKHTAWAFTTWFHHANVLRQSRYRKHNVLICSPGTSSIES